MNDFASEYFSVSKNVSKLLQPIFINHLTYFRWPLMFVFRDTRPVSFKKLHFLYFPFKSFHSEQGNKDFRSCLKQEYGNCKHIHQNFIIVYLQETRNQTSNLHRCDHFRYFVDEVFMTKNLSQTDHVLDFLLDFTGHWSAKVNFLAQVTWLVCVECFNQKLRRRGLYDSGEEFN